MQSLYINQLYSQDNYIKADTPNKIAPIQKGGGGYS